MINRKRHQSFAGVLPARPKPTDTESSDLQVAIADILGCDPAELRPRVIEICSCGRPAVEVFDTEKFGPVGYCGVPGRLPLDPCNCGSHVSPHDRAWCAQRGTVRGEA